MASYESIYEGSEFLVPKYNTAGYQELAGKFGMSLDPRSANQLKEINVKINPGIKHVELSGINAQVFESIPDEHLDEMRRLGQLTGVTTSVHAPIVEASGIGQRGWEEVNRLGAERQLESAMMRSNKLDKNGNVSVVVHTSAGLPEMNPRIKVKNKDTGEYEEKPTSLWVIDQNTGKFGQIEPEKRFFPDEGEGKFNATLEPKPFDPVRELAKRNRDMWTQQLSEVNRFATYGEEIIDNAKARHQIPDEIFSYLAKGEDIDKIADEQDKPLFKQVQRDIIHGQIYLRDSYRHFRDLFDKAWSSGNDKDRVKLKKFADTYAKQITTGIETDPNKLPVLGEMMEEGLRVLRDIDAPKTYIPMQEFAVKKTAETFGNAATAAWEKFQDKAPILNIENPPAGGEGGGLSRAEDLKEVVIASRKRFIENLTSKGVDVSTAKDAAEKMIGATWDVGHINMLRKKGYSEQDIVKQTEIIAPFVKHVHLSDNFGLDHTELPMGYGNVPMKEIHEKLVKAGFKGKEIIEAGNWWQYFAEQGGGNPFKPTLQNYNSPLYAMQEGYTWSQLGGYAGYFSGHGPINPAVHHNVYGSGFANLPVELGGEIPGSRDRLSGTPMQ